MIADGKSVHDVFLFHSVPLHDTCAQTESLLKQKEAHKTRIIQNLFYISIHSSILPEGNDKSWRMHIITIPF